MIKYYFLFVLLGGLCSPAFSFQLHLEVNERFSQELFKIGFIERLPVDSSAVYHTGLDYGRGRHKEVIIQEGSGNVIRHLPIHYSSLHWSTGFALAYGTSKGLDESRGHYFSPAGRQGVFYLTDDKTIGIGVDVHFYIATNAKLRDDTRFLTPFFSVSSSF